jgi:hypothetical protein
LVRYLAGRSHVGLCLTSAEHHSSRQFEWPSLRPCASGGALAHDAARAIAQGETEAGLEPDEVAFALNAIALGAGQARRLNLEPDPEGRARREMNRAFGVAAI